MQKSYKAFKAFVVILHTLKVAEYRGFDGEKWLVVKFFTLLLCLNHDKIDNFQCL